ncbi:uncharacterized protein YecT (DUF1311 family) [Litoreibacter ponti]|uniref:Uncharacterized protein YecT (DUF1311 family) n=1 Tax=Litoreibacter ponti TaxID=1510457 RepID=A0A2T6BKJ2_9RHOB|nr:lysozyme inhibitor LprI family protein [Litoreibacter ponti]PTX56575.1 uncharacterized protein YecT (DUF1311 family) [Litoreibacter ponti]
MIRALALIAALGATPVAAQDLSADPQRVFACHAATAEGERYPDCLGAASNDCQLKPGGSTTPGIAACIASETQAWDTLLNQEYQATRSTLPQHAEALRTAQRAWIAFRDAECRLTYDRWSGGTIRSVAYANCLLVMTAERALALRDMRPR